MTSPLLATVWVDDWQMQCCGDPFSLGSLVTWTLAEFEASDRTLDDVLPGPLIRSITHFEDHHGDLADGWPTTTGVVLSIRAVSCEYAPIDRPGTPIMAPKPGSGVVRWVFRATGFEEDSSGPSFMGYIVELGDGAAVVSDVLDRADSIGSSGEAGSTGEALFEGRPAPTPRQISHGEVERPRDEQLPMLAAVWLANGYDSPELCDVASMKASEGHDASSLFAGLLASLGYPVPAQRFPWDELPWRGYWPTIAWTISQMDLAFSPYAAAQRVSEIASDVPDLWVPAGGDRLMELLTAWDADAAQREAADATLRVHLLGLEVGDVPPLLPG